MQARKDTLSRELAAVRERTLWLLEQVPEEFLKRRVHDFYSPIGWHFGHIARTEEFWIVSQALEMPVENEHYSFLFADLPENPKDNRVNLPPVEEIVRYLGSVRQRVLRQLEQCDLSDADPFLADGYAWEFALQHECQHQETICEMLQLIQKVQLDAPAFQKREAGSGQESLPEMVTIPAGEFVMGSDDPHGYDNEKRAHPVRVERFEIARTPVTAGQWRAFMIDGGYRRRELWTPEGWAWRCGEDAEMPEYWTSHGRYVGPMGLREIDEQEPVSSVSWFEADAFARWAGMRLPTEAEWEYAARGPESPRFPWGDEAPSPTPSPSRKRRGLYGISTWGPGQVGSCPDGASPFELLDMAGNVWEWTASPFLPYPGFEAFPYDGYSKDHMKGEHRVCRGGSWATAAPILRCSFRNWYVPSYRQGFLGLRLAR